MRYLSSLRTVCLLGLLGSALVIIGFFLPVRLVTATVISQFPQPPTYSADSYWSILIHTITLDLSFDPYWDIVSGSLLLAIFIPLLSSLAALLGIRKRAFLFFGLGFAIFGWLEVLVVSALLILFVGFSFGGHISRHATVGPGFWLMLVGFSLCILSSIAQCALSRLRITTVKPRTAFESLQEGMPLASPRRDSFEGEY
ncbi:MAG TPA: hypothetical protein VH593_07440 [Ktedonobacteraceae bacterium]